MSTGQPNSQLTALAWLIAIACPPLGCLVGLVYLINGSPKAGRMLLVSLLASVALNAIVIVLTGFGAFVGR